MQCNRQVKKAVKKKFDNSEQSLIVVIVFFKGCKTSFHVTCAQSAGLLCEEAGNYMDNVKYCGYCQHHFQRIVRLAMNQLFLRTSYLTTPFCFTE